MQKTAQIFDDRVCLLGEGPFWHPERQQLYWFDILNCQLLSRDGETVLSWQFDRNVSAAGWIDQDSLLIASETGLSRFNLETGLEIMLCPIEADNMATRSNDGRADPWGGFWVGTMSKTGELYQGALYRWMPGADGQNELRVLEQGMTTPNAICFDPDRNLAYYADTKERKIWKMAVDPNSGWPLGAKTVFVDLNATEITPEYKPDGAVTDIEGCVWVAQWGSARVARYSPDGEFLSSVTFPTGHTSCPAFGGAKAQTLFVTTARQKLPETRPDWFETAGCTFCTTAKVVGRKEPRIKLV